ncbi:MAG TPA: hypothetical protein VF796_29625, partial [Humisphaera sp.]
DDAENVDGLSLLPAARVTAASVDDAAAARAPFGLLDGQHAAGVRRRELLHLVVALRVVRGERPVGPGDSPAAGGRWGGAQLPIRRTVGWTFAWLGKCRRLGKDRERTTRPS